MKNNVVISSKVEAVYTPKLSNYAFRIIHKETNVNNIYYITI